MFTIAITIAMIICLALLLLRTTNNWDDDDDNYDDCYSLWQLFFWNGMMECFFLQMPRNFENQVKSQKREDAIRRKNYSFTHKSTYILLVIHVKGLKSLRLWFS